MTFKRNLIFILFIICCKLNFSQLILNTTQHTNTGASSPIISSPPIATPTPSDIPNRSIIDQVISIVEKVEGNNNLINLGNLNPDSNIVLPAGIIKDVGTVRYIIAIDSLKFKPQESFLSAYAAIEFPGTTEKLAFRGSNIKFNPSGVVGGNQARLYLASSHVIQINPTVRLRLKANNQNWVEWDCNGFKAINLVGNFEFYKGKIKPDPSDNPNKDTVVTASFQIYTQDIHNFIISVNITPFTLEGLPGWSFKATNATVDMSELANATSFSFPPDYPIQNLASPEAWTGFALKSLVIKLPGEISKTGKKTEIIANNMQIDNMGFSGIFQVNNLFNMTEGSMSGWAFSVEELGVGFVTNRINSGHLKGKVNIPLMQSDQTLQYTADINYNYNTRQTNYNFVVSPASNLNFNVLTAKVNLNNNSRITVLVQNGNFKPSANLSGEISFDGPKMNSNGGALQFENLNIITESPYITSGLFTLHNIMGGQPKAHNYPININDITFGINQGAPVLGFSVNVNLSSQSGNALSVGTALLLKGKINTTQQTYYGENQVTHTKTIWTYDKCVFTGFSIDIQTSPFTLKGTVLFKDDDPVYGNGFIGSLEMAIPKVLPPSQINVCFGSKTDYKYFYLDARIPVAFQLGSLPVMIYRVVGGLYYNMTPNKTSETDFINLAKNSNGVTGNALSYTPDPNTSTGLKAGVSYKSTPTESAFNGDVMLEINFTSSGGLGIVKLSGDIYGMATIAKRVNAPVKGAMVVMYDAPAKVFDAQAGITVNAYNAITGTGSFKVHFDPQNWYLCIGTPKVPNTLNYLGIVTAPSYFMMGTILESPEVPSEIASLSSLTGVLGVRDNNALKNMGGFCAGARVQSSLSKPFGWDFFSVNASYSFIMGWDMMMANYGENAHCFGSDSKIGMNGWLAEGAMYLHMAGNISIKGSYKWPNDCPKHHEDHHLCGRKHCCCIKWTTPCIIDGGFSKTIFSLDVNAVITAKGPKPLYFAGEVNAHYDICEGVGGNLKYSFDYGQNCVPVAN